MYIAEERTAGQSASGRSDGGARAAGVHESQWQDEVLGRGNSRQPIPVYFKHTARISSRFLFSLFLLNLLPEILLHLDTIVSMSSPVCSLAPFVAVARLKQEITSQYHLQYGLRCVTFLHPAHLLFFRFVTSAWQNQQILSALRLTLPLASALAGATPCLASLASPRIVSSFFPFAASGNFLMQCNAMNKLRI